MISYGAVIGKVTPLQLVVMAILEVFAFWVNIRLVFGEIEAHDVGGGMVIHTFGAYFGLAATRWLNKSKFDVVHMQNATLAGGVAMGVAGDMNMGLHGAMIGGFSAGVLSCVGYSKVM